MDLVAVERAIRERMRTGELPEEVIAGFVSQVFQVAQGYSGKIPWQRIGDLDEIDYSHFDDLIGPLPREVGQLNDLVLIKLNGGLGTSMGLDRAKSLIPVKDDFNFLQIIRHQLLSLRDRLDSPLPLLFMNSFNTREDTMRETGFVNLNVTAGDGFPVDFLQNMVPRLVEATLLPFGEADDASSWCPPGHGDIYLSLKLSGLLENLLEQGYQIAFISNGDNLGAIVESDIYRYFKDEGLEFLCEVTAKTRADLKGGVLFRPVDEQGRKGEIDLLEVAQVEEEHVPDFEDVIRFSHFNINNLWINLEALRDRMKRGGLNLSLIRNTKNIAGTRVLQLETAMGSAIGNFHRARAMVVPRTRFAPVKTCADLLLRRSDAYILDRKDFALRPNPSGNGSEAVVVLGDHYKSIGNFEKLMVQPPSLCRASRFEVNGPILFDQSLVIEGEVRLIHEGENPVSIKTIGRKSLCDETLRLG